MLIGSVWPKKETIMIWAVETQMLLMEGFRAELYGKKKKKR